VDTRAWWIRTLFSLIAKLTTIVAGVFLFSGVGPLVLIRRRRSQALRAFCG
jgi:hypothetical protein